MRSLRRTITFTTILWVAAILAVGQLVIAVVVSNWQLQQYDAALQSKARALATLTEFDGSKMQNILSYFSTTVSLSKDRTVLPILQNPFSAASWKKL